MQFEHRKTYDELPPGRDRYIVGLLRDWLQQQLAERLPRLKESARALDVGCGEQPLRSVIESHGLSYTGMDIVQNSAQSVDIIAAIDAQASNPAITGARYDLVLCTEVLEHVADLASALSNMRQLLVEGGLAVVTVPFVFPLHMEPYDYVRLTPHALSRLADQHGFAIEQCDKLGSSFDVICTLGRDTSILPGKRNISTRTKALLARKLRDLTVQILASAWFRRNLVVASNSYLSNAVVMRAV
jgi:predicted TPR repeat methyltransferase